LSLLFLGGSDVRDDDSDRERGEKKRERDFLQMEKRIEMKSIIVSINCVFFS
jgi:hypothetical protein